MQKDNKNTKKAQPTQKQGTSKKYWRVGDINGGGQVEFLPVFKANEETGDIETRYVEIRSRNKKGDEHTITLNWLDLYMFVYFACNEELRQQLAQRYEREVKMIPYDVTIKVSDEEKATGIAKRRVELPVDELTMAIARNEAWKLFMLNKSKSPKDFLYRKKKN